MPLILNGFFKKFMAYLTAQLRNILRVFLKKSSFSKDKEEIKIIIEYK